MPFAFSFSFICSLFPYFFLPLFFVLPSSLVLFLYIRCFHSFVLYFCLPTIFSIFLSTGQCWRLPKLIPSFFYLLFASSRGRLVFYPIRCTKDSLLQQDFLKFAQLLAYVTKVVCSRTVEFANSNKFGYRQYFGHLIE